MRASLLTFWLCVVLAGVAPGADSLHCRLVGEWGRQYMVSGVAVKGKYAYVVGGSGCLSVISVADPAHPVEVGRCSTWAASFDVAVHGDYAYVASGDYLQVFSISDPLHPAEVGRCSTQYAYDMYAVAVSGDYAYAVGDRGAGLAVFSVADPAHPVQVGSCGVLDWAGNDVTIDGDYAYVVTSDGLHIISVADPSNPVDVGKYAPGNVNGAAVGDGYAYVALPGSFLVTSIADPTKPVEVGRLDSAVLTPWGIALTHGYAFIAGGINAGLWAISVRDPARPTLAGYYGGRFAWYSVVADGDYVYYGEFGLRIFQFYQLGDLDVDNDSLDVAADTLRLRRWTTAMGGAQFECAYGEFILANTSASYNPDSVDGPSVSPVDSLSCTGSLAGPGGTIDSIVIPDLPDKLAQGQSVVCTLAAYVRPGLRDGDYTGSIFIGGKDTAGLQVYESCYVSLRKASDIDIDNDSLDVVADTICARPRLLSVGPPPTYTEYALGAFILANTSESYNPDTLDGPSRSTARSLRFCAALTGLHGTIDSVLISNLPESLSVGQTVICTLAVYVPPELPDGDYSGSIVITRADSLEPELAETVYARVTKLGDLDVDNNALDVLQDTVNLRTQPAGPVYSPYAKARFMLVNSGGSYNPDAEDGPSRSPLREFKVEAEVEAQGTSMDSVYVLNLPESLAVGQAVECTLALVLPVGTPLDGYTGLVSIDAYDTLGYLVRDSFFLAVYGPEPRQNLDSLRVAPIPFKPNQDPEHDAIHFQGLTSGARVVVYDASGQSVWSATETSDGHLKWDAKVASGIYVYAVVAKDGQSRVGKLSVIR